MKEKLNHAGATCKRCRVERSHAHLVRHQHKRHHHASKNPNPVARIHVRASMDEKRCNVGGSLLGCEVQRSLSVLETYRSSVRNQSTINSPKARAQRRAQSGGGENKNRIVKQMHENIFNGSPCTPASAASFAPFSRRRRTTSKCPSMHATCSGVSPPCVRCQLHIAIAAPISRLQHQSAMRLLSEGARPRLCGPPDMRGAAACT